MSVVTREFEERDAEGVAGLLRDLPWLTTPETILHRSRTLPARARARRWVAEEEGAIVGWAQTQFKWVTARVRAADVIREFEERDAEGVAALLYDLPWFVTAELLRHRLRTTPPRAHARRWIAKEKDEVVGWAQTMFEWESARVDVAAVWVFVAPDRRGAGIGSRLYELAVGHSLQHGARELKSGAWEDEGDRFLVTRGYEPTREERFSALDPRTVDTSGLALPDGFRLVALAELAGNERDVYALYAEAYADQPSDHALTNIRFDEWVSDPLGNPELSKEGSFVILAGDTPAALAWIKVVGKRAQHDLTGTARRYRRRGLARAAKLATIRWCAEHGIERLATGNDSTNVGMLAINDELGYRPWITRDVYVRRL